jgi:hypothetical protein
MSRNAFLLPLVALAACAGLPRTTTPAERAEVGSMLATIETALGVLKATGKIPADHYAQAMLQVADLRAAVAASEATPVTVSDLFNRALGLAAAWAITLEA